MSVTRKSTKKASAAALGVAAIVLIGAAGPARAQEPASFSSAAMYTMAYIAWQDAGTA
jgi:hypothetical protein